MAVYTLEPGQTSYTSNLVPSGAETGNAIYGNGLDNNITGNQYNDTIFGNDGDDYLRGEGGNDTLVAGNGNDRLDGGSGTDILFGQDGNDILYGGSGSDTLWGGLGNDRYEYAKSDGGIDTINDDKSPTGQTGYGGGATDVIIFADVDVQDIFLAADGNDLLITDAADAADGIMHTGVRVEDFFLGGDNVIERVYGNDLTDGYWDLTGLVA
ncbi:calcium-binding protein [Thalassospira xiamenensis]|uniref:Hemolysin-type calcium-binding repeat-containing protein n=1 Tax=Thalassospira xiamenensis TaxID=220697 RepID=A0A285TTW8_9PROT|nr:calcium-binding protein [Thalassospira xiamenensis]SOC24677.1 Hemolysin-type calcium-binding repeat-containing protein [Thalassospira xiamenensis]